MNLCSIVVDVHGEPNSASADGLGLGLGSNQRRAGG